MIFIMSEKQFMENKRKLVKMKDYMICDCADGKILNKSSIGERVIRRRILHESKSLYEGFYKR